MIVIQESLFSPTSPTVVWNDYAAVEAEMRLHLRKSGVVLVYYTVGRRMDGIDPISPFCRVSWIGKWHDRFT